MDTVKLKLVGAKNYVGPRTKDKLINKGETYDFTPGDAAAVLKETWRDSSNNDHPLFVEVAPARRPAARREVVEEEYADSGDTDGGDAGEPAPAKPVQRRSRNKGGKAGAGE